MTIPVERSRAIVSTREFLYDLVRGAYPRVPKVVKQAALAHLRHYPSRWEVRAIGTKYGNELFDGSET